MKKKKKINKPSGLQASGFIGTIKGKYLLSLLGMMSLLLVIFHGLLHSDIIINAMDVLTQDYFWASFVETQLRENPSLKTWNPYLNGGAPFGGGLGAIFTPLDMIITIIFSPNLGITVKGLFHLLIAGSFTLMYARLIGLGFKASFLSAIFFMLSTELVSLFNAGHIGKLNTIAFLPVVLFFLERAFIKRRFTDFILAAIPLSLQLYHGHIQISFYCCLVVAIYFIWRSINVYNEEKDSKGVRKLYLHGTVMVLLFFTLSAFSLSSWFEFKEQSDRKGGTPYAFATSWSMPPKELVTYVAPQIFGLATPIYKDPGEIDVFYWGDMPFTQTSNYLGLAPILLSLIALLRFRGRYVYIFLTIALLFQFLAFGKYNPAYPFFYNYLGFKFFRVPKMLLFVAAFSVSMLAGFGAQWLFDERGKKGIDFIKKYVYWLAGLASLMFLCALVAQFNQQGMVDYFFDELKGSGRAYNPSLVLKRYVNAIDGIWIALSFLITGIAIIASKLSSKVKPEWLFLMLAAYFVIDISSLNYKFINGVSIKDNAYLSKDTAVKYFEKDDGLYRVLNAVNERSEKYIAYHNTNKYVHYKIQSATGYEAVQLGRYGALVEKLNLNGKLLDIMNIKYVVMAKGSVRGTVGDRAGKYDIVMDEDVKILRNRAMLPRVYPVHKALIIKDKDVALSTLTDPAFKPSDILILEDELGYELSNSPKPARESQAKITSYKNAEIMIEADMADKGFLFLGDKFYPGWKVVVDGRPEKIHVANYAFRAVYLDAGKHDVKFYYENESYKNGLLITAFSILFVIAVFLGSYIIKRRKLAV